MHASRITNAIVASNKRLRKLFMMITCIIACLGSVVKQSLLAFFYAHWRLLYYRATLGRIRRLYVIRCNETDALGRSRSTLLYATAHGPR